MTKAISMKEQYVSNAFKALGNFFQGVDLDWLQNEVFKAANSGQAGMPKLEDFTAVLLDDAK
jgi:hypothetical protein